jgi:hypothetical protein
MTTKLPCYIIPIPNQDKQFHEVWHRNRDLMDIPHPFRGVLAAKPNSGKTCVIFNIILRVAQTQHPFEQILVVHCDPDETKEYSAVDCTLVSQIPSPEEFSGAVKSLIILEDLDYQSMGKDQKGNLDRLFGYVSTHKNCSVILTAQNPFSVPASVRRCANFFVLWSSHDLDALSTLARKSGLKASQLHMIFQTICHGDRDSLWIDLTLGTPAKLRKNCYEKIMLPGNNDHSQNQKTKHNEDHKVSKRACGPTNANLSNRYL